MTDLSLKQYYAHREKLKLVNRETDLKAMNMKALQIAREVADETGTLMAGNICNSTIYKKGDEEAISKAHDMFKVQWVNHYCKKRNNRYFVVNRTKCKRPDYEI